MDSLGPNIFFTIFFHFMAFFVTVHSYLSLFTEHSYLLLMFVSFLLIHSVDLRMTSSKRQNRVLRSSKFLNNGSVALPMFIVKLLWKFLLLHVILQSFVSLYCGTLFQSYAV